MTEETQQVQKTKEDISIESSDLLRKDLENLKSDTEFEGKRIEMKKWLFEQRLDYGRFFFDHHAKQRMSMFNYFLIFVGFVLTAYATLFKDGQYLISTALASVGALLTLVFIILDRRNEELVHISEDVLESLEWDLLFSGYNRVIAWPKRRNWLGFMNVKSQLRPIGIFRRQSADTSGLECERYRDPSGAIKEATASKFGICTESRRYEHGKWLPRFQLAIFGIFVFLAVFPWVHREAPEIFHVFH